MKVRSISRSAVLTLALWVMGGMDLQAQVVNGGPFVRIARLSPTASSFGDNLAALVGIIRYRIEAFDAKGASPFVEASVNKQATAKGAVTP